MEPTIYSVTSIPNRPIDKAVLFEAFSSEPFFLIYDFLKSATSIGTWASDPDSIMDKISRLQPGLEITDSHFPKTQGDKYRVLNFYRRVDAEAPEVLFSDVFEASIAEGMLIVLFVPQNMDETDAAKNHIEKLLSRRSAGQTVSISPITLTRRTTSSQHTENFERSEEALFLNEVLESLNGSILRNGMAYRLHFVVQERGDAIMRYLNSRFLILSENATQSNTIPHPNQLKRFRAMPVGIEIAKNFITFKGVPHLSYTLETMTPSATGELIIGTFMKSAVFDTKSPVRIDTSALNLGFMITGLPGSGKTTAAMGVIDSVASTSQATKITIISPTSEWSDFAQNHGLVLVKLYDEATPINFFRCPQNVKVEKFYESLAMVLSSVSGAGPYRNPMEKCMLNAFRKVYATTREPDPVEVYEKIEQSIADFHAKKTNSGYRYTKHGENIRSALEGMRAILSRSEYSVKDGIILEQLLNPGVVFDISNASPGTKQYLYALILNQVYSVASEFGTDNDDKLRLLICLEEAQMVFRDNDTAAVEDLKYRIQDFRKQGVGLMLLTHNVNDIESSIRRLCQIKLYLKQAPDVATIAARDLVFTFAEEEDVVQKLKHLNSRIGAFSGIVKEGRNKIAHDTVFVNTREYQNTRFGLQSAVSKSLTYVTKATPTPWIDADLLITIKEDTVMSRKEGLRTPSYARILYIGETVSEFELLSSSTDLSVRLAKGKPYTIQFMDAKKRLISEKRIVAAEKITIRVGGL